MPARKPDWTTTSTRRWNERAQVVAYLSSLSGAIVFGFEAAPRSSRPDSEKSGLRPSGHRPPAASKRTALPVRAAILDLRSAGIGQAQQLRRLVEGFADGVVERGAEPHIVADAEHRDDLGVPA